MDGQRFDAIARGLTERVTRRRVMRVFFGLATGASALAGADDAGAAARTCRVVGSKCVQGRQCCSGYCQATGRRSRIRTCSCPEGTVPCNGGCVPLGSDEHCLACNDACSDGTACCDDGCTELGTQGNCTACGDACDIDQDELCISDTVGCQHACYGHTTKGMGGFFTTDTPPVLYLDSTYFDALNYTRQLQNDPNLSTLTLCQTSADCTYCPSYSSSHMNAGVWEYKGCGCLQVICGDGSEDAPTWEDVSTDGNYYCAALYRRK